MLLCWIWLVDHGPWSPESQCFDFRCFCWRDLEFLRYHQGLFKYSHLFSLSIYRETEKDQSVNLRSKQVKRRSTKQGLCCATLANSSLKIQLELCYTDLLGTLLPLWAQALKAPLEQWITFSCPLRKDITCIPTHCRCLRGPNTNNLVAAELLQAVLTAGRCQWAGSS